MSIFLPAKSPMSLIALPSQSFFALTPLRATRDPIDRRPALAVGLLTTTAFLTGAVGTAPKLGFLLPCHRGVFTIFLATGTEPKPGLAFPFHRVGFFAFSIFCLASAAFCICSNMLKT